MEANKGKVGKVWERRGSKGKMIQLYFIFVKIKKQSMFGQDGSLCKGACSASLVTCVWFLEPARRWKETTDTTEARGLLHKGNMECISTNVFTFTYKIVTTNITERFENLKKNKKGGIYSQGNWNFGINYHLILTPTYERV